ncbi:MAG: universal stress protein [Bacteroidales bacterium]
METTKPIKVLIALDYDPTAKKIADAGYKMAKAMKAEVVLLHVISDPVYYASVEYSPIMGLTDSLGVDPMKFEGVNRLNEVSQHFLDGIKHHLGDKSIQTIVFEGDFAESILKSAKDQHAGIIVLGSHSHKWLENIILGSVAEKVLRHSTIPLFIVPTKKRD